MAIGSKQWIGVNSVLALFVLFGMAGSVLYPNTAAFAARIDAPSGLVKKSVKKTQRAVAINTYSFFDNFDPYNSKYYSDTESFGPWHVQFTGYGSVGIEGNEENKWLLLSPMVSTQPSETHASLVTGPIFFDTFQFESTVYTRKQLRAGSPANPWEVAWVIWHYTDNDHFYYFIPKPNGWELGKRDPRYPGGQRFLATGSTGTFPIGNQYTVKIVQDNKNRISVWVNGSFVTSFVDTQDPYTSGAIGFYTEDATVEIDNVIVYK